MKNIALIGMSGCGKSTVGDALAMALARPLVDIDRQIVLSQGVSIADIFAAWGEPYFRDLETAAIRAAAGQQGVVIATGGGCVLRPENMACLAESSHIIYVTREMNSGVDYSARPLLSGDPEKVYALFKQRKPLYERYAHLSVDNNGSIQDTVDGIRQAITALENLSFIRKDTDI